MEKVSPHNCLFADVSSLQALLEFTDGDIRQRGLQLYQTKQHYDHDDTGGHKFKIERVAVLHTQRHGPVELPPSSRSAGRINTLYYRLSSGYSINTGKSRKNNLYAEKPSTRNNRQEPTSEANSDNSLHSVDLHE
ncbi:hypothetical protein BaRGS_00038055 [Batillaria attramentaria]|uniref:Uncharacterized protein n=1 Tax=Batillaria attramentaria TaxID=370345 RepID=A0ABD0J7D2_9CAEN